MPPLSLLICSRYSNLFLINLFCSIQHPSPNLAILGLSCNIQNLLSFNIMHNFDFCLPQMSEPFLNLFSCICLTSLSKWYPPIQSNFQWTVFYIALTETTDEMLTSSVFICSISGIMCVAHAHDTQKSHP